MKNLETVSIAPLHEPAALLEALLANSLDLIFFKDHQSRYVRYSRSFAMHFGQPDLQTLIGKTDYDLYPEDRARAAHEDEQRIIRTGQPVIGRVSQGTRVDGRLTWTLTTKMPWRDSEGNIIGTYGVSKDVTDLKKTEAQLAETEVGDVVPVFTVVS